MPIAAEIPPITTQGDSISLNTADNNTAVVMYFAMSMSHFPVSFFIGTSSWFGKYSTFPFILKTLSPIFVLANKLRLSCTSILKVHFDLRVSFTNNDAQKATKEKSATPHHGMSRNVYYYKAYASAVSASGRLQSCCVMRT